MNWCRKSHLNSKLLPSFQSLVRNWTFIFSLPLPPTQAIGLTLVGLGAWLEIEEQSIQAVINQQQLLFGPYIIIAVGCIVVLIAFIGMVGACCDKKLNRFLLGLVSASKHCTPSPLTHHLTPSHLNFCLSLSRILHTHPYSHTHTLTSHTWTPSTTVHCSCSAGICSPACWRNSRVCLPWPGMCKHTHMLITLYTLSNVPSHYELSQVEPLFN